jgi:hypothetical protein
MSPRLLTTLVAVGSLAAAGTAVAADQSTPTTIEVAARTTVAAAPDKSPIDFAGVPATRRGKPLPSGYVVVGRKVSITHGTEVAYAALTIRCPAGKTLRGLGVTGQVAPQVQRPLDYAGKRAVEVIATFNPRVIAVGRTARGTVLAVCR